MSSDLWYQTSSGQQLIDIIDFHNFNADAYIEWVYYDNINLDNHREIIHKDVWDLHLDKLFEENEYRNTSGYHFPIYMYKERELELYADSEWEEDDFNRII